MLFMAKSPHGLLFPRCGAAIHHGGAGHAVKGLGFRDLWFRI